MGVLLQPDDRVEVNDIGKRSPLVGYAAEHWVIHAQFEGVSSYLRKAMEYLFDLDKPYFAAWRRSHNRHPLARLPLIPLLWLLCVTAGRSKAIARRNFRTAKFLRHNGADMIVRRGDGHTPLLSAAWYGDLELVGVLLLDYKVDVNARGFKNWTAIHYVSHGPFSHIPVTPHYGRQLLPEVARLLLEKVADVNARDDDSRTALHIAAQKGRVEVVRVLLEHGANADAEDNEGRTPLHLSAEDGRVEAMRVLLEHGANVGAEDNEGGTAFQIASAKGNDEIMKLLSEHGAEGIVA
ncbi:ankyrin repeat-containing domain protein [Russula ochroleuca]|uniref:Ankyrin repeat-containing domain protein n=1 Tax=Russula ochroleuca TaxID=152965 RepID=A0A9P5MPW6_9AGAM|nr:ankyrin repeat-containing domain protein [Russula ochroleuca]